MSPFSRQQLQEMLSLREFPLYGRAMAPLLLLLLEYTT